MAAPIAVGVKLSRAVRTSAIAVVTALLRCDCILNSVYHVLLTALQLLLCSIYGVRLAKPGARELLGAAMTRDQRQRVFSTFFLTDTTDALSSTRYMVLITLITFIDVLRQTIDFPRRAKHVFSRS